MNDTHSDKSSQRNKHAAISPEMLELMGKQACNLYIQDKIGLNESLSKMAEEHNNINQEQIKRICEFANNSTYLALHDKNKTAGLRVSYPEFDVADPSRVIQNLSDGAESTTVTQIDADYSRLPSKKQKLSSVHSDALLAELFLTKTAQDRAELDYTRDSIVNEVMATKYQLTALRSNLCHANEQFDLMLKEAQADFYELAKRHCMDGGSVADLYKAAEATGASEGEVWDVIKPIILTLSNEDKVKVASQVKEELNSIKKLAHRVINSEHPMIKAAGAIIAAGRELKTISDSLLNVENGLDRVNDFIQERLSARSLC